jgi:hypothetical protein
MVFFFLYFSPLTTTNSPDYLTNSTFKQTQVSFYSTDITVKSSPPTTPSLVTTHTRLTASTTSLPLSLITTTTTTTIDIDTSFISTFETENTLSSTSSHLPVSATISATTSSTSSSTTSTSTTTSTTAPTTTSRTITDTTSFTTTLITLTSPPPTSSSSSTLIAPVHLLDTFDSITNSGHTGRIRVLKLFDLSALNDSFNQSSQGLLSGADDSRIKMWRLNAYDEKDPLIRTFDCSSEVRALTTTTNSPFIFASGLSNGDINIWNITDGLIHNFLHG